MSMHDGVTSFAAMWTAMMAAMMLPSVASALWRHWRSQPERQASRTDSRWVKQDCTASLRSWLCSARSRRWRAPAARRVQGGARSSRLRAQRHDRGELALPSRQHHNRTDPVVGGLPPFRPPYAKRSDSPHQSGPCERDARPRVPGRSHGGQIAATTPISNHCRPRRFGQRSGFALGLLGIHRGHRSRAS